MNKTKQYPLEQSPLYNLRRKKKLEELFLVPIKEITALYPDEMYTDFSILKKDGTERAVSAPNITLKAIQRRMLTFLQRIETPEWLISGKHGKSYIDNARFHLGSSFVITIDIRKFYDNCRHKYIYPLFIRTFKTSPDVAHLLSKITTRLWLLPTGAPSSQLIAFFAYRETFEIINSIADKYGCRFSLYVDDMTFSSENPIPAANLLEEVSQALHNVGHRMKFSKIIYYTRSNAKLITGVIIDQNGKLRVPNDLRRKIMDDLKQLKNSGLSSKQKMNIKNSILGRINAARLIEPNIFPEVYKYARTLNFDE